MVNGTKTADMNTPVLGLMSYNVERLHTADVYFRSLPQADEGKECAVVLFIVRYREVWWNSELSKCFSFIQTRRQRSCAHRRSIFSPSDNAEKAVSEMGQD